MKLLPMKPQPPVTSIEGMGIPYARCMVPGFAPKRRGGLPVWEPLGSVVTIGITNTPRPDHTF
jgi:hypothetical protein